MTQLKKQISPLRQRMIDEMNMRKLGPNTQKGYLRAVARLAKYLKHSPEQATSEQLRQFQIALVAQGTSSGTINATLSGIQFLYCKTLDQPDTAKRLCSVPTPRRLPNVLSIDEVKRLIEGCRSPKYRAALSVAYGAGLRISEVVALKVSDIDSDRMVLNVEQGKGNKDRLAKLSPVLLDCLRDWYQYGQSHHLMLKGGWLFPGQQPYNPMSTRQLSRGCMAAAKDAGIEKRVSMHCLRHSFATHLLEAGVDIRVIQTLLGHSKLDTTALYTQVATKLIDKVVSPLDALSLKPQKDDE
jgi:integrase/recombinase XerD